MPSNLATVPDQERVVIAWWTGSQETTGGEWKPGWLGRLCNVAADEVDSGLAAAPRKTTGEGTTAPQWPSATFVLSTSKRLRGVVHGTIVPRQKERPTPPGKCPTVTYRSHMPTVQSVCVFCGSSPGRDPAFAKAASDLGRLLRRAPDRPRVRRRPRWTHGPDR